MKIILNKVNIWMIQSVINTFELPLIYPLKISEGFLVFSGTMELEHWLEMGLSLLYEGKQYIYIYIYIYIFIYIYI